MTYDCYHCITSIILIHTIYNLYSNNVYTILQCLYFSVITVIFSNLFIYNIMDFVSTF